MSGGHFQYLDSRLKDEMFGWCDKPHNVLEDRELSALAWDMLEIIHAYDWYRSGDTCEETYLKKKLAFKNKWLKAPVKRVKSIVDSAVDELREELYKTYGLEADNDL